MLRREFAAARIAGEGAQFLSRLGLENVDAHGLSLSDLASGLNAADNDCNCLPFRPLAALAAASRNTGTAA
jgi:hypothetical protein